MTIEFIRIEIEPWHAGTTSLELRVRVSVAGHPDQYSSLVLHEDDVRSHCEQIVMVMGEILGQVLQKVVDQGSPMRADAGTEEAGE